MQPLWFVNLLYRQPFFLKYCFLCYLWVAQKTHGSKTFLGMSCELDFCMLGLPLFSVLPFFIKGWWVSWEMAALSVPSLRSPQATFWKFSDQDYHLQKAWKWKSLLKKLGLSFFSDLYTDVGRVNPSEKVQISIVFWIH